MSFNIKQCGFFLATWCAYMYNTMVLFMNYSGTQSKFTVFEFMSVD